MNKGRGGGGRGLKRGAKRRGLNLTEDLPVYGCVCDDISVRIFIWQVLTLYFTKHFVSVCATGNPGLLLVLRTGFITWVNIENIWGEV